MKKLSILIIVVGILAVLQVGCQKMQARCKYCGPVVKVTTLRGVHFDFNKYHIRPDGVPILNEDIKMLKDDPALVISIEGHCDSVGSDEYNNRLSERRARAVMEYLMVNGISSNRMRILGFGKRNPIVSNDTDANRALNRRVEVKILAPQVR
ncbi:MAG: OmpA family protein [Deltaproteobacteria bacterium]|jgi:OmpA-OmpF porin, OOP family|nr:OmpA family protein [Deltaproteobacteria bacterium]